ncbi:hypothetical protein HKD37_19G054048 [Glycine soja]
MCNQWMYNSMMSEEVDMNVENEEDVDVKVEHLFASRDEVLQWTRSLTHDIGFVVIIMRSNTNTGVRGRVSFLLITCKRCGEYRPKKHNLVRTCTNSRKCGCPFKLYAKPSFVGHPYVGRLTMDEKIVVVDMMKFMVEPRNILLTLKEYNDNSYTIIKQIYNARHAYRSSIRRSNTKMQQRNMLLDRDQYIHWHRLKDDNVVHDLYKLSLLDIVGVTPTRMTFFAVFAYLEKEHLNNVVWALQWFQGLFMRVDAFPGVIIINRDFSLMNAVKTVFLDATNMLCRFHIDKNVMTKVLWSLKILLQNSIGDICSV